MFWALVLVCKGLPLPGALHREVFLIAIGYFIVTIPLALCAVIWRRRFLRLPRWRQWSLTIASLIPSVAAITILYFGIN